MSHAPDTQAREPIVDVHVPPGTGRPFDVCGWQTPGPLRSLHQLPEPHWESVVQVLPQEPVVVLQNGPAWPAPQSASELHLPQLPFALQ